MVKNIFLMSPMLFCLLSVQTRMAAAEIVMPEGTPDVIECNFVCGATVIDSKFMSCEEKPGDGFKPFSFKITGLAAGKPVLVRETGSSELKLLEVKGKSIFLIEDVEAGLNVVTLHLDYKKVSFSHNINMFGGYVSSAAGKIIIKD